QLLHDRSGCFVGDQLGAVTALSLAARALVSRFDDLVNDAIAERWKSTVPVATGGVGDLAAEDGLRQFLDVGVIAGLLPHADQQSVNVVLEVEHPLDLREHPAHAGLAELPVEPAGFVAVGSAEP